MNSSGSSLTAIGVLLALVAAAAVLVAGRTNRPGVVLLAFVVFGWAALAILAGAALVVLSLL